MKLRIIVLLLVTLFFSCAGVQKSDTVSGAKKYEMVPDENNPCLYINKTDLLNLKLTQSTTLRPEQETLPNGDKFSSNYVGIRVWRAEDQKSVLADVRDIRLIFSTPEMAQVFENQSKSLSEGAPKIISLQVDGVQVNIFGPRNAASENLATSLGYPKDAFTAYTYVFRVDNVVAKIFLFQGLKASKHLSWFDNMSLVEKTVRSIKTCTQGNILITSQPGKRL